MAGELAGKVRVWAVQWPVQRLRTRLLTGASGVAGDFAETSAAV